MNMAHLGIKVEAKLRLSIRKRFPCDRTFQCLGNILELFSQNNFVSLEVRLVKDNQAIALLFLVQNMRDGYLA